MRTNSLLEELQAALLFSNPEILWSLKRKTTSVQRQGPTIQVISQPTSAAPGLSSHKEQNQPPRNVVMTFPNPNLILI